MLFESRNKFTTNQVEVIGRLIYVPMITNLMPKKTLIIGIIVLILIASYSICLLRTSQEKDNLEKTVSWDEAIDILNGREVREVFQSHNLSVTLTLKNSTVINTKEPVIDEILDELEKCGDPCSDIILSTQ